MRNFETDFARIFGDPIDAEAQKVVENGTGIRAAVPRPVLDRPASEWTEATRIAAVDELAHIFGGPNA